MGDDADNPQDLITIDGIEKALCADEGEYAELMDWEVVDFTKAGDNYACFVTSVRVHYSLGGSDKKTTYIVKLNPCMDIEEFEEMINMIFIKEARFYTELLPELDAALVACGKEPLRFPRLLHADLEAQKEQMYFEDLRSKGFKLYDRKEGMDESHAKLVLKELARLHASSYILQARTPTEPPEEKYDFLLRNWLNFTDTSKEIMGPMIEGYLTNSAELLRIVNYEEKAIAWVESLIPQLEDIVSTGIQAEKFSSICHGDCWNNNVLFRYSYEGRPLEVMLVDLQLCHKGSLASDLNYFFYTSLTGSIRNANLTQFLSTYYSTYRAVLDGGLRDMHFTEEELLEEFRDKNTLGAMFGMVILQMVLLESDDLPDLSGDISMEDAEALVKGKAAEMLESDPVLKPRFLAIFDELMETGLIS